MKVATDSTLGADGRADHEAIARLTADERWLALYEELAAERGLPPDAEVTATRTLAEKARQLGQEHAAAGIAPFGDANFVYWDGGSADLMAALGETGSATGENYRRRQLVLEVYCEALDGGGGSR